MLRPKSKYSPEDMEKAVNAVREKKISFVEATLQTLSKKRDLTPFEVSRWKLEHYSMMLKLEEELVSHKLNHGPKFFGWTFRNLQFVVRNNPPVPFKMVKECRAWVYLFRNRHNNCLSLQIHLRHFYPWAYSFTKGNADAVFII